MKSFIYTALALLIIPNCWAGDPKYRIRWTVAHQSLTESVQEFAKNIQTKSHGRIQVDILLPPGGEYQLFAKARADLLAGKIEMSQISTGALAEIDDSYGVLSLPFIFADDQQVEAAITGPLGSELKENMLAKSDGQVRTLEFTYSGGFKDLLVDKMVSKPEDLQKLHYRTAPYDIEQQVLNVMKLSTSKPKEGDDKDIGVEILAGKLDGEFNHVPKLRLTVKRLPPEVRKKMFLIETHNSIFLTAIVVNEKFFKSLPKDLQALLVSEANKMATKERKWAIDLAETSKNKMKKWGVTVVKPSPVLLAYLKEGGAKIVKNYQKKFGSLLAKIPPPTEHPRLVKSDTP